MITVMGEALIDIIVDSQGEVAAAAIGGAPLNTARTLARLDVPVSFLGGMSTDAFGRRIARMLEDDGVGYALGSAVDAPTTLALAERGSEAQHDGAGVRRERRVLAAKGARGRAGARREAEHEEHGGRRRHRERAMPRRPRALDGRARGHVHREGAVLVCGRRHLTALRHDFTRTRS